MCFNLLLSIKRIINIRSTKRIYFLKMGKREIRNIKTVDGGNICLLVDFAISGILVVFPLTYK